MISKQLMAKLNVFKQLAIRQQRPFSAPAAGAKAGAHGGHEPNPALWEKIFWFGAVPAILLSMLNTYLAEKEHMAHYHRPEFKKYEYMRIRTKKFPWGDGNHSLFHNPAVNALPNGYETPDPVPTKH